MKQDFIEYLELCVREKKLSHAFLVETNNQEEFCTKKIFYKKSVILK